MKVVEEQYIRSDKMEKIDEEKIEDLLYIKNFSKITIKNACKRLGIDASNLWKGKCSAINLKRVRRLIENDLAHLYIMNDKKDSTL